MTPLSATVLVLACIYIGLYVEATFHPYDRVAEAFKRLRR